MSLLIYNPLLRKVLGDWETGGPSSHMRHVVSRLLASALNNFFTMRDLLVLIVLVGRITVFELENNDSILEIIYGIVAMI